MTNLDAYLEKKTGWTSTGKTIERTYLILANERGEVSIRIDASVEYELLNRFPDLEYAEK
jgi:hypothetical protein